MVAQRGGPGDASGGEGLPSFLGRAAAAGQDAQQAARRYRAQQLRLTEDDRTSCTEDLAEAYAVGRLDDAEFGRRLDLLHSAVTHGDLTAVYDGLPPPSLYAPAPRRPGRWRWMVFTVAAWMAAPFLLLGMVLGVTGHLVGAGVFALPALLWLGLFWRWARTGTQRR